MYYKMFLNKHLGVYHFSVLFVLQWKNFHEELKRKCKWYHNTAVSLSKEGMIERLILVIIVLNYLELPSFPI